MEKRILIPIYFSISGNALFVIPLYQRHISHISSAWGWWRHRLWRHFKMATYCRPLGPHCIPKRPLAPFNDFWPSVPCSDHVTVERANQNISLITRSNGNKQRDGKDQMRSRERSRDPPPRPPNGNISINLTLNSIPVDFIKGAKGSKLSWKAKGRQWRRHISNETLFKMAATHPLSTLFSTPSIHSPPPQGFHY